MSVKITSKCQAALRCMALSCLLLGATNTAAAQIELSFGHKTVGNSVQYTPNLATGGFAEPTRKPRFSENTLGFLWQRNKQLSIEGSISDRQFTTLRDSFGFRQATLTLHLALQRGALKNTNLWFSLSSNTAAELTKNSYTTIDNQVIKSVTIKQPSDRKIEVGLQRGFTLSHSSSVTLLASLGITDTKHSGLYGDLSRGDCNYKFNFGYQGGSINQVNQCGNVTALNRAYPDDNTVQQDFGVSPAMDLRNKAVYARAGLGFNKALGNWSFATQYYFQKYLRDQLDNRIRLSQNDVYDANHVASITTTRSITNQLSLTTHVEYHLHRYLDEVPVLYTRLTSERFKDSAVFFSVSMKYRLSH